MDGGSFLLYRALFRVSRVESYFGDHMVLDTPETADCRDHEIAVFVLASVVSAECCLSHLLLPCEISYLPFTASNAGMTNVIL